MVMARCRVLKHVHTHSVELSRRAFWERTTVSSLLFFCRERIYQWTGCERNATQDRAAAWINCCVPLHRSAGFDLIRLGGGGGDSPLRGDKVVITPGNSHLRVIYTAAYFLTASVVVLLCSRDRVSIVLRRPGETRTLDFFQLGRGTRCGGVLQIGRTEPPMLL